MDEKKDFWLRDHQAITQVATFGHSGSSSEAVATYMEALLGRKLETPLFDSFELASGSAEKHGDYALLVANAYRYSDYYKGGLCLLLSL